MQFQKLSAPSLKELFVTQLENKILSGELKVGEKLPSERELATSMQVSRAVVNAGISEMEQKGFLIVRPRVGTFVEDYRKNGTLETLVSIMKYNGGSLAKDEVKSVLELRIVLVNLASSLALENASDEELANLQNIVDELAPDSSNEKVVDVTFRLHHELAYISRNNLLPLIFVSFKDLVCRLWLRFVLNYGTSALIESDKEFVRLLIARDKAGVTEHVTITTNEAISGDKSIYSK
ncbi:MAG: GntR family transcriptional regulator [Agathobacter sp.]|nr:GntR family transcriptional regulator [Agathobacter sp.]